MADLISNEIIIEHGGNTFTFRTPSMRDEARMGAIMKKYLYEDSGREDLSINSLDEVSWVLYRAMAVFEVLLKKTDATWVYKIDPQTKEVSLDYDNFNTNDCIEIFSKFDSQTKEFFRNRTTDGNPSSVEAVAGQ